jgi:hypothetical protein
MDLLIDDDGNLECTICSETIGFAKDNGTTESAVELPCGHTFGDKCLDKWRSRNNICPNCRASCPDDGRYTVRNRATREATDRQMLWESRARMRRIGDPELDSLTEQLEQLDSEREGLSGRRTDLATTEHSPAGRTRRAIPSAEIVARRARREAAERQLRNTSRTQVEPSQSRVLPTARRAVPVSNSDSDDGMLSRPPESLRDVLSRNIPFECRLSDATNILDGLSRLGRRMPLGDFYAEIERSQTARLFPRSHLDALEEEEEDEMIDFDAFLSHNPGTGRTRNLSQQRRTRVSARQSNASQTRIQREAYISGPIGREAALRSQEPHLLALWMHQQNMNELYELRLIDQGIQGGDELRGRQR